FLCGRRIFFGKNQKAHIFFAYLYHTIPLSEEGTGFSVHISYFRPIRTFAWIILLCRVCCFKMNMYMSCSV
ncbi:hypothetical protein QR685DRAFT_441630, partial [Neurospora intermedia]